MEEFVKYFNIAGTWAVILLGGYVILNLIGELIELKGKIVPEFMKIRKFFQRRKKEKEQQRKLYVAVEDLLSHYNSDNIDKRNAWMTWVNNQAEVYDKSIEDIKTSLSAATAALSANTAMTEEMFVENSRDRIIDFAEKVVNSEYVVSHEQFKRIFRVYEDYENWLKAHNRSNGEIDINYQIILDAYKYRVKNHCFAEDIKGYQKKDS